MEMIIGVATMRDDNPPGDIGSWLTKVDCPLYIVRNTPQCNKGVVGSYQEIYENTKEEIIGLFHDDVICREDGWNKRVLKEFENEQVSLVGFGGALQHGDNELFKVPYQLQQLKRHHYRSNVDDAEIHGERFTGVCDVAVLDGFALIVRRSFLDRIGGWGWIDPSAHFIGYDYALCAMARRLDYHIRLVGVRCHHRGGTTSTSSAPSVRAITSQEAYDHAHRWFYDSFKDVMPTRVNP